MYEIPERHIILLQQATRFGYVYLAVVLDHKEFYQTPPLVYVNISTLYYYMVASTPVQGLTHTSRRVQVQYSVNVGGNILECKKNTHV